MAQGAARDGEAVVLSGFVRGACGVGGDRVPGPEERDSAILCNAPRFRPCADAYRDAGLSWAYCRSTSSSILYRSSILNGFCMYLFPEALRKAWVSSLRISPVIRTIFLSA
jgi:hypothetical protein